MKTDRAQKLSLMGLSLLLSVLIFLFILSDLQGETRLTIPITTTNVPTGLIVEPVTSPIAEIVVCGPRIMLLRFRLGQPEILLNLEGALPGTIRLQGLDSYIKLPPEVRLKTVSPAELQMAVRPAERKKPD